VPDSTGEASPLFNGWFAAISFWRAAVFELRFANKGKSASHFAFTFVHRRSHNHEKRRWHGPCNTDFVGEGQNNRRMESYAWLDTYQPFDKSLNKIERQIMKKRSLLLAFLSITALTASCQPSAPSNKTGATAADTNASSLPVTQQWQNVKSDITNTWQDVKQTTTQALAAVKTSTTQAWASVKNSMQSATDYTYSQKDVFVAKMQGKLDVLDQNIKQLSNKVAGASTATKADAQAKLKNLRDKRAVLDKKLDEVKNATKATWNDVKNGFENSYDDLKNSLKQTWQWMSDKAGQ
jgi:hypothetical protein